MLRFDLVCRERELSPKHMSRLPYYYQRPVDFRFTALKHPGYNYGCRGQRWRLSQRHPKRKMIAELRKRRSSGTAWLGELSTNRGVARGGHGCMSPVTVWVIFWHGPVGVLYSFSIFCPWTPLETPVPKPTGLSLTALNKFLATLLSTKL